MDEPLLLLEGGGAYCGGLAWKKDRMDVCEGLPAVVGSDMMNKDGLDEPELRS